MDPVLQALIEGGTVAVMAIGLWAFLTGKLIAKPVHDESVAQQEKAAEMAAKIISQELKNSLEEGVASGIERGIVKGYLKVNGGDLVERGG